MSYKTGLVATLAELEQFYKGQDTGDMIELMNQTNDCMNDVPWMESNRSDGHTTRVRTGLPDVHWRRLYKGTPNSKSQFTQVKEACGMLESRAEIDVDEMNLYGDKAKAFRMSEALAFTESMRQKVATTLFYGNADANPDEFNGIAMRYGTSSHPHCINAGGVSGNMASMFLMAWGPNSLHGIYPKGSTGGLDHKELGEYQTLDTDGNKFEVVGDKYLWRCGIAVRDWRAVVRICNIPVADLTKRKGEVGFIDMQALTIQAKNKMPQNLRDKAIWYCNSDVLTALELQSTDAGNVHLVYGDLFNSKAIPNLHGRPIRQCDALLSTETVI